MKLANKIKQLEIAVEMGYREYKNKKARTENPYTLASLRIAYEEGQDEAELELNEINLAKQFDFEAENNSVLEDLNILKTC